MGVTCKSCGHDNRLAASYCGKCAKPLTGSADCPRCASHNPTVQNFCNSCGSALAAGKLTLTAAIRQRVSAAFSTVTLPTGGSIAAEDTSEHDLLGLRQSKNAIYLTLAIIAIAIVAAILAATRLWGLGSTPSEITLAEEAFLQVARQIEFEGWIGLSHDILDGALTGYAYVLSFWTNFIGDDIGIARLISGVASLASIGVSYLLVSLLFNRRVALFAFFLHGGRCLADDLCQAGPPYESAAPCGGNGPLFAAPSDA